MSWEDKLSGQIQSMTFELQGHCPEKLAEARYPAHQGTCRVVRCGQANCGRVSQSACSLVGWNNSFMLSHWLNQQLQPPPCQADPGRKWDVGEKADTPRLLLGQTALPASHPIQGPQQLLLSRCWWFSP